NAGARDSTSLTEDDAMRLTSGVYKLARTTAVTLAAILLFASAGRAQLLNFPNPVHPALAPQTSMPPTFDYPFMELTSSHWVCPEQPSALTTCSYADLFGSTTYDGTYLTITTFPQWLYFRSQPAYYSYVKVQQTANSEPG